MDVISFYLLILFIIWCYSAVKVLEIIISIQSSLFVEMCV